MTTYRIVILRDAGTPEQAVTLASEFLAAGGKPDEVSEDTPSDEEIWNSPDQYDDES